MDEETKVTPESEEIDSTTKESTEVEKEIVDTGDEELQAVIPSEKPSDNSKPEFDTVPLKVFLDLKSDLKELKKDLKEANTSSKSSAAIEGVKELANKYPDVSEEFMSDLFNSLKNSTTKELDSKYTALLEKQEYKDKLDKFNTAFNKVFDKAIEENPELPKDVDKKLIKTLIQTEEYRNVKVSDILTQIYGSQIKGKDTSEDETSLGAGEIESIKSFDNMTKEQESAIISNPKTRKKYFDWLDEQS